MNLPDLPEGYYYKYQRGSYYDRVHLMQKRRWGFDKKVASEYADLLSRFPKAETRFHHALEVLDR